ncbi:MULTISPECIES: hypothetical protein [unclassified Pseudomonas]|uniref:hypothetical protein n=1 Tax=unclassified Pseudomonas TaxID=196821 RepID=UPI000923C492|nr:MULTISPECIES: hypothetical protein [unclassified Pseudomonas]SFX52141.1 delta-60 repeat domain-containing protein [Pseudomonas sp. NFACC47-1]SFX78592.1 delta-60 repeat domain-containing protein [Pseudomonas sp. NFACC43]
MTTQKATQAPGSLDPSFGEEGNAFYFPPVTVPTLRLLSTSRLRTDGKIFSAGYYHNRGDLVLVRFLSNGRLDDSFGEGGVKVVSVVSGYRIVRCVLELASDDSAFISCSFGDIGAQTIFVCKVLPNGELDASFGSRGIVFLDFSPGGDVADELAIQADGKILLSVSSYEKLLVRLDTRGDFDPGFGSGGIARAKQVQNPSLIVLPDGRLLVAGSDNSTGSGTGVICFVRYLNNGAIDPDFGEDGTITIDLKNTQYAYVLSAVQQRDGKIVAVGAVIVEEKGYFTLVTRININGSLDSTFNNGVPILTGPPYYSRGEGVAIQPDNKILVGSYTGGAFHLMRYLSSGALDLTFGVQGKVMNKLTGGMDKADTIALQADGKIVQLGRVELDPDRGTGVGIARYFG